MINYHAIVYGLLLVITFHSLQLTYCSHRILDSKNLTKTVLDLLNPFCAQHVDSALNSYLYNYESIESIEKYHNVISKFIVVPVDGLGLANRLRMIGSFFTPSLFPAEETIPPEIENKSEDAHHILIIANLIVLWLPDDTCNAKFDELFSIENPLPTTWKGIDVVHRFTIINILNDDTSKTEGIPDNAHITSSRNFHTSIWRTFQERLSQHQHDLSTNLVSQIHLFEHYPRRLSLPTSFMEPIHNIYSSSVHLVWTKGVHFYFPSILSSANDASLLFTYGERMTYYKSLFHNTIQPSASIENMIKSVIEGYLPSDAHIVGVHIRVSDLLHDWEVVSPILEYNTLEESNESLSAVGFSRGSSLDAFVLAMQGMAESRPSNQEVVFFLASNSQQVKELLPEKLSDLRIITLSSEMSEARNSALSMQLAAVEFFLLGECHELLHTRSSSFAKEAAFRKQVPVLDVSIILMKILSSFDI